MRFSLILTATAVVFSQRIQCGRRAVGVGAWRAFQPWYGGDELERASRSRWLRSYSARRPGMPRHAHPPASTRSSQHRRHFMITDDFLHGLPKIIQDHW